MLVQRQQQNVNVKKNHKSDQLTGGEIHKRVESSLNWPLGINELENTDEKFLRWRYPQRKNKARNKIGGR